MCMYLRPSLGGGVRGAAGAWRRARDGGSGGRGGGVARPRHNGGGGVQGAAAPAQRTTPEPSSVRSPPTPELSACPP